ncbi:hypothetical protein ACOME3_005361 [Neoechinorhynchus agilis]
MENSNDDVPDGSSKAADLIIEHVGLLPIAPMIRLLKSSAPSLILSKDAKSEISACIDLFILFVATLARDNAELNKRKLMMANDVLAALKSSRVFNDDKDLVINRLQEALEGM